MEAQVQSGAAPWPLQGLLLPIAGPRPALCREPPFVSNEMAFPARLSPWEAASGQHTRGQNENFPFSSAAVLCAVRVRQIACFLDDASEF